MDLHGIDLNLLVAFDALMAERSVTRAGARIGRTQPAMSAALGRLRALFGDQLFVRSRNGLQPTPRAVDLAGPLSEALALVHSTLAFTQQFDPRQSRAIFTLGVSDHPAFSVIPGLVSHVRRQAPSVALHLHGFTDRDRSAELLEAGEIDLALGVSAAGNANILSEPLFEEMFVCIARKDHPDLADGKLDMKSFLELPHLLVSPEGDRFGHVDAKLSEIGAKRRLVMTLPHMYAAPRIVAETDLIAVVMQGVVAASGLRERLTLFAPPLELPRPQFVLSWHRRNDAHPAQDWLRRQIIAMFRKANADALMDRPQAKPSRHSAGAV
jgi:DNA-binding transcriptional LysR family regulator